MDPYLLSIVGFFSEIAMVPVNPPVTPIVTPKQVLDQYKADQAAQGIVFDYTVITNPFLLKPDGSPRNLVASFTYKGFPLTSNFSNVPLTIESVWQFYIVSASGMVKPNDNPRQTFDEYQLAPGDTVIWRLVTVYKSPQPKRLKQAEAKAANNLPLNY